MKSGTFLLLITTARCCCFCRTSDVTTTNVRRRSLSGLCSEDNLCHKNATCIPLHSLEEYVCECKIGFTGDGLTDCTLTEESTIPPAEPSASIPTFPAATKSSPPNDPPTPSPSFFQAPSATVAPIGTVAPVAANAPVATDAPFAADSPIATSAPAADPADAPSATDTHVGGFQSKNIIKDSHVLKGPIL
jgi:hypothetical protein